MAEVSLDNVLEAVADALVVCDSAERIVYLNSAAERLLAWEREALVGQPVERLLPERARKVEGHSLVRYLLGRNGLLGGRPLRVPTLRRDGVEVVVELTVGASGAGEQERIVLSLRRMPELIEPADAPDTGVPLQGLHAPAANHEPSIGESFYRTVVENAPLGIVHFDRTPIITTCNDYFVRLLDSSKRYLIGLNPLTLRDKRIIECVRETLEGRRSRYEGDYRSLTGGKVTPVRVHFAPCFAEDGKTVTGGVGIVEDITERRQAEEENARHLAQLDTLFHTMPVGLGLLDTHLRYARVNEVLARLNNAPIEAHLGRRPRDILGPKAGGKLEALLRRVLKTGEPLNMHEMRARDLDPRLGPIVFAGSLYPVRTPEGRILGVGALLEDVTERKLAEEERARLYREAQEAVRVRDDFLTIASHELKTPLTPLSLRLASLERRLERGEHVDPTVLRQARKHLVRLTSLINDLLDASRIEAGRLALHPEPTRLDSLVEHVIHELEPLRSNRPIDFVHPSEPVQVLGDSYRLQQVVTNLLENALKYSPDGGTVHVNLQVREDVAVLSVRDEGIGIPPSEQKHLFERYFRAHNVSSRSYGGLGLGLYICRDIVERHGGRIWVESKEGQGSTFYVALPLLRAHRLPAADSNSPALH